jgi:hypothetical protein
MVKKMADETKDGLLLKFTGKATILFELEDFDPISIGINDIELCTKIMQLLIDNSVEYFTAEASNDEMIERYRKVLDEIK